LAQATCHSKHSIKVGPLHSRAWLSAMASSSTVHALTACCTPMPPASNTQSIHGRPMSVSACDAVACPLCGIFCRASSSCNKHMQPCQIQKQRKCIIPGAAPTICSRLPSWWYMQESVRCSPDCTTCCMQLIKHKIQLASDADEQIAARLLVTAHLQDSIGSVGTNDGDDLQLFSDLCPQGLQRIHGTTISLQAYIHTSTASRAQQQTPSIPTATTIRHRQHTRPSGDQQR